MSPKAGSGRGAAMATWSIRASPLHYRGGAQGPAILLAAHRRHYQAEDPMYTVLAGFVEAGRTSSSAWRGRCLRRAASG